jgi:hypothetical protein
MKFNRFIRFEKRMIPIVKYWSVSKHKKNEIRGSFDYELYLRYRKAINDNSMIIQNPK